MGHTHYWTFNSPAKKKGNAAKTEKQYQLAIRQCQRLIKAHNTELKAIDAKHPARLSGYSVHCKVAQYGGLNINGTQDLAHETFAMREHYSQNLESGGFEFCKTAQKPYDVAVVACLIVLKHYLGDLIEVESDGDAHDWLAGLELAKKHVRIKTLAIPKTIRRTLKSVS